MRLLLTGFEPFGTSSVNPSQKVVEALAQRSLAGIELVTAILPVDRARGPAELLRYYDDAQPDAAICLGEAGGVAHIALERVAINLLDFPMADNGGQQAVDEPVVVGGPAAYFATLPLKPLLEAMREARVPARLSLSAGSFLCNQVLYTLLYHTAQTRPAVPCGFIHLPILPEQAVQRGSDVASMSLETALLGITAAIATLQRLLPGS